MTDSSTRNWEEAEEFNHEKRTENGLFHKVPKVFHGMVDWLKNDKGVSSSFDSFLGRQGSVVTSDENKVNKSHAVSKPEKTQKLAMESRNQLEEQIMAVIGGRTGMLSVWEEIVHCAHQGDDCGFLFFGRSFTKQADILCDLMDALKEIIDSYKGKAEKNQLTAFVASPYRYEADCRMLIKNAATLEQSGLLDRDGIDAQELTRWLEYIGEGTWDTSFAEQPSENKNVK